MTRSLAVSVEHAAKYCAAFRAACTFGTLGTLGTRTRQAKNCPVRRCANCIRCRGSTKAVLVSERPQPLYHLHCSAPVLEHIGAGTRDLGVSWRTHSRLSRYSCFDHIYQLVHFGQRNQQLALALSPRFPDTSPQDCTHVAVAFFEPQTCFQTFFYKLLVYGPQTGGRNHSVSIMLMKPAVGTVLHSWLEGSYNSLTRHVPLVADFGSAKASCVSSLRGKT